MRTPPRPLRAVLFDWDGTIVDSAEASFRCYVRLFESYRIPFDRERFERTYSPDWYRTYTTLGLPKECWDEADARWLGFYAGEENVMLSGAREALVHLQQAGIALGIVTSGNRARVARELEGLRLRGLFGAVISAEDVEKRKPDPEPIVRGLELMAVPAAEAAYVGDSPEDVEMARAAGVYVVGVPGPFPNREELKASAPDMVCDSLAAAVAALLGGATGEMNSFGRSANTGRGLDRLAEHRRIWEAKPVLADVYAVWFEALLGALSVSHRRVLELGAGPGFFSDYARRRRPELAWIAADILETPPNDLVADGLRMPFRSGALDAILALDVVHHLARPRAFFEEAARVLAPGGCVAVVEPWVTPLSYPIYRWLHQECCTLGLDPWQPFGEGTSKEPFDGDASVVWLLLRRTPAAGWAQLGFRPPRSTVLNGFAYLASLGFRERSLLPRRLAPALLGLDAAAGALAPLLGVRVHVVWEREAQA